MKKEDKDKEGNKNAQITLTGPAMILRDLEDKCAKAGTTPSKVMTHLLQRYVFRGPEFWSEIARYHAGKMHEAIYMRDRMQEMIEMEKAEREDAKVKEIEAEADPFLTATARPSQ